MSALPSLDWTLVAQALRHGGPDDMVAELDRQGFRIAKKTTPKQGKKS